MLNDSENIINIIASYLKLEKKGKHYFTLCPFHVEKTPSFMVNEKSQRYYCFGCNRGGNAITFLMEYKKFRFKVAANIVNKNKNKNKNKNVFIKHMLKPELIILNYLARQYHINLKKKMHLKYIDIFLKKRCITLDLINRYGLGLAPDSWSGVLKMFRSDRCKKEMLIKIGMIVKKSNHEYDRFRNRLMFPIRNIEGFVIGFGGRNFDNKKPKYINSIESKVFSKRNELYGIYEVSLNIYNTIILVEGYMDVITMYKNNIKNVVAILGTNFTTEQFKLLQKTYKRIIFCYDNDVAGNYASVNTAKKLIKYLDQDVFIGFIFIPKNLDPDTFLNMDTKYNRNIFINIIKNPIYILDLILIHFKNYLNINNIYNNIIIMNKIYFLLKQLKSKHLKKLILKYFQIKLNQQKTCINNKNILTLPIKICLILLKDISLIQYINVNKLICDKNEPDLIILFQLINLIKNKKDINKDSTIMIILKKYYYFYKLINKYPKIIIKDKFIYMLHKIKINL